jgi:RNA polymerase sigma-70 factor (ECF subfamily)
MNTGAGRPARSLDAENREEFQLSAESYRRELKVHCYRILGSIHEAEDAVQDTMLRAWRNIGSFEGRSSLRSWLYRIATNVCLNMLAKRSIARRTLPELHGSPALQLPSESPATEIAWLEPYPDAELEGVVDIEPGPHARYEQREAMRLAFIAAIQYLPGRQRAALLLHDVVGWSAAETAEILDMSAAAINSALQRARATLKKHVASADRGEREMATVGQRSLLDRYVRAWEAKDLDGLVALLKEDAVLSMPPLSEWYQGHDAIRAVCAFFWSPGTLPYSAFRLIETKANGQPAFALYARSTSDSKWHAHVIQVLTLEGDAISALTYFVNPNLFRAFGFAATTPS